MSKKYVLTAPFFEGSVTYGFADNKLLEYLEINVPNKTDEQHEKILKQLGQYGLQEDGFLEWAKHYRFSYLVVGEDYSFKSWWSLYGYKRGIDVAEPEFDRQQPSDLPFIFKGTRDYNIYCGKNESWYNKMLPKTFLKNKEWKTEWLKLKRG